MLPKRLLVRVLLDGVPMGGMFVIITTHMGRKNDFKLAFGPTGDDGLLAVSADDLRREGKSEKELFPMDYGDIEADFTGAVSVQPMGVGSLRAALKAFDVYRASTPYPASYEHGLRYAEVKLRSLSGTLSVKVEASDDATEIVTLTEGPSRREGDGGERNPEEGP